MNIKDILVYADGSDAFESRLEYTIALAQSSGAHLTALYIVPRYTVHAYAGMSMDPGIIQQSNEREWDEARMTQQKFESMTKASDIDVEWRVEEGDAAHHLNSHGRYFDLVVLGQTNPKWDDALFTGIADDLVISLGRPALVVPYVGALAKPANRILVAWDGSHSAARAVNDAMPFLKVADQVEVMTIKSDKATLDEGNIPAVDISLHLARHGVKATAKSLHAGNISDGDLILSHACDFGADLLVMGAYGHSRFRELILGGVTRNLLQHMTLPVLMSH
jgi:nucleotide-binding universal stress UspA family protein